MQETYPIPEALTKSPWEIVDGQTPKLMPASHKIVVPLSPDQHDQVLRTHELAHLKWSPKEIPKDLNPAIMAMVEDARIIKLMREAKVKLDPGYPEEIIAYTTAKLRATKDRWGALLFRVGMTGMPGQDVVDEALAAKEVGGDEGDEGQLANLRYQLHHDSGYRSPSWSIQWTKQLQEYIKNVQEEQQQQRQQQAQTVTRKSQAEQDADREFQKGARAQADRDMKATEVELGPYRRSSDYTPDGKPKPFWFAEHPHKQPWGKMRIEEPPLTQRMPGRFGRQRRPTDVGAALTYPARLWQDAKVFGRKLKGHGGSVLIDGSGSMSLTPEQIWEILRNAPGASIAIYASDGTDISRGVLRILAKKGLVVKAKLARSPGGGNVVDFPALKWLAKQSEPRIWVSDGHVTGAYEQQSPVNRAECFDLCKRERILRVQHMPQAINALERIRLRRAGIITNAQVRAALKTGALDEY